MTIDVVRLSEMLLVGFVKSWGLLKVLDVCGIEHKDPSFVDAVHKEAPFMPPTLGQYGKPTRAYIATQWPKLNAYLLAHEQEGAAVLKVAPQLRRLTSNTRWAHSINTQEANELAASRKVVTVQRCTSRAIRSQRESHQRGAWNVCK